MFYFGCKRNLCESNKALAFLLHRTPYHQCLNQEPSLTSNSSRILNGNIRWNTFQLGFCNYRNKSYNRETTYGVNCESSGIRGEEKCEGILPYTKIRLNSILTMKYLYYNVFILNVFILNVFMTWGCYSELIINYHHSKGGVDKVHIVWDCC